jgi:hypothetical protein
VGLLPGKVLPVDQFNVEESSRDIACTCVIAVASVPKFITSLEERKDGLLWSATHLASAVSG